MKIAGMQIFAYKPIAFCDSTIGRLAIFSISFGHSQKLLQDIGGDLASCDPKQFVKSIIPYVCYPSDVLGEEPTKPAETALSVEDVDRLTDEDIDRIAGLYVDNEPYLYRKQVSETKTAEDGKQITSVRYGEVEHPKQDGEGSIQYLHRLYVLYEKQQQEEMARLSKSVLGASHFSSQAFKSVADTLAMGNSMARSLEAMRFPLIADSAARAIESMSRPLMADYSARFAESVSRLRASESAIASLHSTAAREARQIEMAPVHPTIDLAALEESAAKARWAPFEFLAERIDSLTEVSAKTATFMVEMNKTQTAIAAEIKVSGEQSTRLSQKNLRLTIVIVVLTVIGLILASVGVSLAWTGQNQNSQGGQVARQYVDGIRSDLRSVADGLSTSSKSADDRLNLVLDQLRQDRADLANHLDKVSAEQTRELEQMKRDQAADRQTIERLRAHVLELESQQKSPARNESPGGGM